MKNSAFTLIEQLVVLIIVAVLAVILINTLKPNEIKTKALKESGKSTFSQIEFATKHLLAKNATNYNLTKLKDAVGTFSIAEADNLSRLVALYKEHLIYIKDKTLDATYGAKTLTDGTTSLTGKTASSFSGFTMQNKTYVGFLLHDNCTTTISYIYDPSTPDNKSRTNTCGLIFFDVNAEKDPNRLGVDQYIIGLDKFGVN